MGTIARIFLASGLAAVCGVASAADYSAYRVIDTAVLHLLAGPANTAALLSPDGKRLLYIDGRHLCILMPAGAGEWSRVGCTKELDVGLRAPEDALWSPRGDRVVMPTYVVGWVGLYDTDIRVFDPRAMTVTNLTDDGYEGGLLHNPKPGNFDLIARWLDEDTIAFLRYRITMEGIGSGGPPSVMTIKAAGGAPAALATISGADRSLVYVLAVSADGGRIAYSYDDRSNPGVAGIYVLEGGGTAPKRVAAMAEVGQPPAGMAFSADGNFLLLLGQNETKMGLDARVLDFATGKVVPVDASQNVTGVAWSPTGSALAYVTTDRIKLDEPGGLFLANRAGEPGRRLLKGAFMPPVCCGSLPFTWASNDTMILGNVAKHNAPLFVRLGK